MSAITVACADTTKLTARLIVQLGFHSRHLIDQSVHQSNQLLHSGIRRRCENNVQSNRQRARIGLTNHAVDRLGARDVIGLWADKRFGVDGIHESHRIHHRLMR